MCEVMFMDIYLFYLEKRIFSFCFRFLKVFEIIERIIFSDSKVRIDFWGRLVDLEGKKKEMREIVLRK